MLRNFATKSETRKERLFWLLDFLILLFVCVLFFIRARLSFHSRREKICKKADQFLSPLFSSPLISLAVCFMFLVCSFARWFEMFERAQ